MERDESAPAPALRAVIDEVRAEEHDVDWARVEAKLFDEHGNVRGGRPPTVRSGRAAAIGAGLALAAAFAIALISPTRAVDDSGKTAVTVTRPALVQDDGRPLQVGDRVLGGAWLKSSGRIGIRLEPGTIATVVDTGERVHLALESGAVVADVVPVPGGEPFAVDVAGKRVAVHGTRLRIALVNGNVEVAVSEGSAVVGAPRGKGRTEGTIVPAGNVGSFGATSSVVANQELASHLVDDALTAKPQPAPTTVALSPAPTTTMPVIVPAPKHAPPAPAPHPEVAPPPAPKLGLTADQLNAPLASFAAKIGHCAPSVFENTLTLDIAADGKAELVGEDPGLDSPMRACVRGELARITFPTAEASTTVKRYVKFTGK